MEAARYKRLREIVLAAGELSGDARDAYVSEACGEDAELRREVEAVLAAHPDVALAAVIAVPDRLFDEVGVAFVLPAPDAAPLEDDLKAHCRRHLANYKIPKRFRVRRDLPLLPIGKLDKKALKAWALEQDGS